MKFNEFGKTGMRVSEIGFGGSRIGGVFADKHSPKEALNVLRKALDSGITFYDTADMYAQGESESLIGMAFRGQRDQVIIATKGGYRLPARRNIMKRIKPLVRPIVQALGLKRTKLPAGISGALSQDFSPSYLTKALESSLKRLQTDHVDLYQLHSPGAPFLQSNAFGEALQALENLKRQGKLRFYGVATEVPADAPFCLSAPGISSVQLGFGLLDLERLLSQNIRRSLLDTALQFCRGTPTVSVTLLGMRVESQLRDNLRYIQAPPLNGEEYAALRHLQKQEK
jgi:aryl-alcohol dehydrogenase-like predicted oxidoreductase